MCEPIPCNEQRYDVFTDLQGHLVLIYIWKHVHREAKAHGGVSIPSDQPWLGWSTSSLFCRAQGRRCETMAQWWMCLENGVWEREWDCRVVPQQDKIQSWPCSEDSISFVLHSLQYQPEVDGSPLAGDPGGNAHTITNYTHTHENAHTITITPPSTGLIQGVEGPGELSQIPQCFSCWKAMGHGQSHR